MNDYLGHPIYIGTKEWQCRKHKKKRINKKWLKRYGCYEIDMMPHGQIIMMDDAIWMTKKTFQELKDRENKKNGNQNKNIKSSR